jgi:hypothetical protein
MICFGIGGLGPLIVGQSTDNLLIYCGLAAVVGLSTLLAAILWWSTRGASSDAPTPSPENE